MGPGYLLPCRTLDIPGPPSCLGLEAEEASLNPRFQTGAQETSSPGRDSHLGVSWVRWHFWGASWNLSCQRGLESEVPFTCSSPLRQSQGSELGSQARQAGPVLSMGFHIPAGCVWGRGFLPALPPRQALLKRCLFPGGAGAGRPAGGLTAGSLRGLCQLMPIPSPKRKGKIIYILGRQAPQLSPL